MGAALSSCARVLVAVAVLSSPAFGATLYVSPAGLDANPGTLAAPLATPGRALQLAGPGDTILLRGGTYTITRSLQITQPGLTIRSYSGEYARIVGGTSDLTHLTSVIVVYAERVRIENLEVQGASYYGIKLDDYYGPQPGIIIRGVFVHHTGRDGIKVQSADGVLIEHSEIAFSGVREPSNAEGIDVMSTLGATIRGNYVHDIATNGIFVKAGTRQALVDSNRVERTGYSGILLGSESDAAFMRDGALYEAADSVARNNIVVDTAMAGLGSVAGDGIRFENNTVINAARSGQAVFRAAPNAYRTATRNVVLRNNIFVLAAESSRPMVQLYDYAGVFDSDANVWFSVDGRYNFWRETSTSGSHYWSSLQQWQSATSADRNSKAVDPALDAAALYRPRAGSPAIDAGLLLSDVVSDYSGTPRPQGITHDAGAHETGAGTTTPPEEPLDPGPAPVTQTVPSGPSGLTATAAGRATIALKWTDASANEQGFRIERSSDGGAFSVVATVAADAQAYSDGTVKVNKTYTYRVSAFNAAGTSPYSNSVSVTARR